MSRLSRGVRRRAIAYADSCSENREHIKAHESLVALEAMMSRIEKIPVRRPSFLRQATAAKLPILNRSAGGWGLQTSERAI